MQIERREGYELKLVMADCQWHGVTLVLRSHREVIDQLQYVPLLYLLSTLLNGNFFLLTESCQRHSRPTSLLPGQTHERPSVERRPLFFGPFGTMP